MKLHLNRWGQCLEVGKTIITLGWNIWGVDVAWNKFLIIHLYPPRLFYRWDKEA